MTNRATSRAIPPPFLRFVTGLGASAGASDETSRIAAWSPLGLALGYGGLAVVQFVLASRRGGVAYPQMAAVNVFFAGAWAAIAVVRIRRSGRSHAP